MTGSNQTQTGPEHLKSVLTNSNQSRLAQTGFDRLKSDSNWTRPAKTGSNWTTRTKIGSNRTRLAQNGSIRARPARTAKYGFVRLKPDTN